MAKWNQDIDGSHLKIAAHSGAPMRVLAGPGTGKSYALMRRVMRLLEEGVIPDRILAVTFTNVAASSLKKDLSALQNPGDEPVQARTLHSLCFEILAREEIFRITGRTPRPLLDFEADIMVSDLAGEFGGKTAVRELLSAYESAFARQQGDTPGALTSAVDAHFKTRLLDWLIQHEAILIGELVPLAYEYLSSNPTAPELSRFDYILVDEYQDLNKAEQSLIDLLARNGELVVIGDDDQSIYGFKYAHPDGINQLHERYPTLEDVSLQICRRCPTKIVSLANELMSYEFKKTHKKLVPFDQNGPGDVRCVQWNDVKSETEGVARVIESLISDEKKGIAAEDVLVLAPRRKLGYMLRDELLARGVKTHTFFQEEALDSESAKLVYAMLNYIANPEDRVALRCLLGIQSPLEKSYAAVAAKAAELGVTPKAVLGRIILGEVTVPRVTQDSTLVLRFQKVEQARSDLEGKSLQDVLAYILGPHDPSDYETLNGLIDTIETWEGATVKDFFIKLQGRIRLPEVTEDAGFVRVMSLHKSKGLTAKAVIVLGCVAGLIPFVKDKEKLEEAGNWEEIKRQQEEARRLFFVALTRARKFLLLSSFRDIDFAMAMNLTVDVRGGGRGRIPQAIATSFFADMKANLPTVQTGESLLGELGIKLRSDSELR